MKFEIDYEIYKLVKNRVLCILKPYNEENE